MSDTAERLKGARAPDSMDALLQLGVSGIYFVFSVEERQKRGGALRGRTGGGPLQSPQAWQPVLAHRTPPLSG